MAELPEHYVYPMPPFADAYRQRVAEGASRWANSRVAIVGLARNCDGPLASNLKRLEQLVAKCRGWQLHIEANDCDDNTVSVLHRFCSRHPQATFHYQVLNHQRFGPEFAGPRTIAMAEHRHACQRWVKACAGEADYVIVIDWDQWGGWMHDGVLNGIGWLVEMPGAYGMASVSLFQHDWGNGPQWAHYDLWALRGIGQANCYWDTFTNGCGGWGYGWTPAVGSPPVLVSSAFGGLCIYRADGYLKGTYDGTRDCEHVPFHQSIACATGQRLYINPSQRSLMHWMEPINANHGEHGLQNIPGDAA